MLKEAAGGEFDGERKTFWGHTNNNLERRRGR
jgi:hypothetical protein